MRFVILKFALISHKPVFRFKVIILLIFFSAILREMGLEEKMTTEQIAKKWENLKARYKVGLTANCVFSNANFHRTYSTV